MPPRLERVANVVLRVPSILLLDLLYRWDARSLVELFYPGGAAAHLHEYHLCSAHRAGQTVCVALLLLPVRHLVKVYLHLLTLLLLCVGHHTSWDYVKYEMERDFQGAVHGDPLLLTYLVNVLAGQVLLVALCAFLMKTRRMWLFCAPLLPLVARLCCLPLGVLPAVSVLAAFLSAVVVLYVALSSLPGLLALASAAWQEISQALEVSRLVTLGTTLWSQLAVPLLFLLFWLTLFTAQMGSFVFSRKRLLLAKHSFAFILLTSVADCSGTPYSLVGLSCAVSYLAWGVLKLCKFYLAGYSACQDSDVMHRGVTEGVTLLLLALQTGLLDLRGLQRAFLLSILLFIVGTSTLQSMIDITNPIVLGLAISRNRGFWRHFRGVSMCVFLLLCPTVMACKIAHVFHLDSWLLILISSSVLTSLQDTVVEKMDELIFGVNAVSRVLEFLVALCVVAYGAWESVFGEWSWTGASIIILHCYFNVWLRAQSGWRSFLLCRDAAQKVRLLPSATAEQLEDRDDVCAICFQEMTVAVVTRCGHFFHGDCLRKWFYVRGTCPLCHQPVVAGARQETPQDQAPGRGAEPALEGAEAPRPKSDGEAPVGQSAARTAAEPLRTGGPEPSSAAASGEQRRPSGTTGEPAESGPGCGPSCPAAGVGQAPVERELPPAPASSGAPSPGAVLGGPGAPTAPGPHPRSGSASHGRGGAASAHDADGPQPAGAPGAPVEGPLGQPALSPLATGPSVAAEAQWAA
ncbi:RING finger protein 145-like isoform X2 [Varanus komodoensis]|uniref:RING finger protein 145-like isoform X2 n=1 Tax=Varanus komodoensis TaxID=61221 RepID=UPI001CF7C6FE|nr:RING finger protein 145-like isoform X2 [Varanus komodoensis]